MAIRLIGVGMVLAASALANPALACMASGPEGYVSGLIWENAHSNVSDHNLILKVEVLAEQSDTAPGLGVRVIEGPTGISGTIVFLKPLHMHSCVGLGRLAGYVVIKKIPVELGKDGTPAVYAAIDYLPAKNDRSRGMRREKNWFFPGEPARDFFVPMQDSKPAP